VKQLE